MENPGHCLVSWGGPTHQCIGPSQASLIACFCFLCKGQRAPKEASISNIIHALFSCARVRNHQRIGALQAYQCAVSQARTSRHQRPEHHRYLLPQARARSTKNSSTSSIMRAVLTTVPTDRSIIAGREQQGQHRHRYYHGKEPAQQRTRTSQASSTLCVSCSSLKAPHFGSMNCTIDTCRVWTGPKPTKGRSISSMILTPMSMQGPESMNDTSITNIIHGVFSCVLHARA